MIACRTAIGALAVLAPLFPWASAAQPAQIAFAGVKAGDCQSVRVFGEDANGDFLFAAADLPRKAAAYQLSPLMVKQVPAGKVVIERVSCFDRRNRMVTETPTPGGLFRLPYVGLETPLLEAEVAPGETLFLGTFELHKVGLSGGLINHGIVPALQAQLPQGTEEALVTVRFDEQATLGVDDQAAGVARAAETLADMASGPAPVEGEPSSILLHARSEGLQCSRLEFTFGRETKPGEYRMDSSISVNVAKGETSAGGFDRKRLKSGRKHIVDAKCFTSKGAYALHPTNPNTGTRIGKFSSYGQFDVTPGGDVYIGALTLRATPPGGVSFEMAEKLGLFSVELLTADARDQVPADAPVREVSLVTTLPSQLTRVSERAAFQSDIGDEFQAELANFLALRDERLATGLAD